MNTYSNSSTPAKSKPSGEQQYASRDSTLLTGSWAADTLVAVHIVLVRHAEAVAEDADRSDDNRFLSAPGRAQAHALGRALAATGLNPERIVTSPFVRAVQTAELIAAALGGERLVEVVSAMAPTRNARAALEVLGKSKGLVLAVGHEPHLSSMAAVLLGQTSFPALGKAQAIAFEGKQPRWTLGFADTAPLPWQAG